ncbi:hypothetical protein [Pseudomonas sp. EA_35y_Pfl2_R111]|uniref:hypothetical protein n=1 Tax=Pseudomonas sp. EA_35y_Pfl2_R111 TaxID=3088689 RepID=UPI0030D99C6A
MPFMTTAELQQHHRNLLSNIALLDKASPDWSHLDRERGEATKRNIKQEIVRVEAELHMAGARAKSA